MGDHHRRDRLDRATRPRPRSPARGERPVPVGARVPVDLKRDCRLVLERKRLPHGLWTRLPLPNLVSDPYPELVAPSDDVVVLHVAPFGDARGELVWSTDAGLHWRRQTDPSRVDGPRLACGDLAAASSSEWWLLCWLPGGMNHSANALRRTRDGGHTWTIVSAERNLPASPSAAIPAVNPVSLAAGSPTRLWFTGSVCCLSESSDGGATWTTVPLNTDGALTSFDVLSARQAWLLAIGQGLWRTTDGTHWRVLAHPICDRDRGELIAPAPPARGAAE
jgi:hypothetical protein